MLAIRALVFTLLSAFVLQDAAAQFSRDRGSRQPGGGQQQLTRPQNPGQGARDDRERMRQRSDREERPQRMTQEQRDQLRKDIQDANRDMERRR